MLKVFLASDHAGVVYKENLRIFLQDKGYTVTDLGPMTSESCDYPLYAKRACERVLNESGSFGILLCGTGIGMSMAANRMKGIRAALCTCEFQARATRLHNNANVLCLGARVTGQGVLLEIADIFLKTNFEGGRHLQRVALFDQGL